MKFFAGAFIQMLVSGEKSAANNGIPENAKMAIPRNRISFNFMYVTLFV